jgi:hypothetical protein
VSQRTLRNGSEALLLAQRYHLPSLLTVEEIAVVLRRLEALQIQRPALVERLGKLVDLYRESADVADVVLPDRIVQCTERFLDGCVVVPVVNLVDADRLHPEPTQGGLQFLLDRFSGEARRVAVGIPLRRKVRSSGHHHLSREPFVAVYCIRYSVNKKTRCARNTARLLLFGPPLLIELNCCERAYSDRDGVCLPISSGGWALG